MTTKIQVRRDLAANWTSVNPTLSDGEIGFETDTNKFKIGANSTAWNTLDYASGSITTGLGLTTNAYGVTSVQASDYYGLGFSGNSLRINIQSPLKFNSYGEVTVNMGQGVYQDSYGRLSLNLGSGLSFDAYGALIATGGSGGGAVDLQTNSGLTLDGYGKLGIALGHANASEPWNITANVSGLRLDSYGLALDLTNSFDDGIYSGLEVGSYGLRIKTSPYAWNTSDKSNGLSADSYGLQVALGNSSGLGEYASGLKKSYYGLSIRLKEMWGMPQPSGLVLNEYGLEVNTGYGYTSGLIKNEYGLAVYPSSFGGLKTDYNDGLSVKTGIGYWLGNHPGLEADSYGLHVSVAPQWAGGKGLELNSYGLSVKTNGNSIVDYDGYGLRVNYDSTSQLSLGMYGLTIDTTKPAIFEDSYGLVKTVFKSGRTTDLINYPTIDMQLSEMYSNMESFDAFITVTDNSSTLPTPVHYVEKVIGTMNEDGTITTSSYASKGAMIASVQFVTGMYGSLICRVTPNQGADNVNAFVKADIVNNYYA